MSTPSSSATPWLQRHIELVIAILLGIASVVTAWSSYQASMFDSTMAAANTEAGVLAAEAESLYLEGNQQYLRDGQLYDRITELSVHESSSDAATAALASETRELLEFQSLSEDFAAAIAWSNAENEADPEYYTHPQGSDVYLEALFGGYEEVKAQSTEALERASASSNTSGQFTLATVLLAISLFLFGIAALLRTYSIRLIISGVATVVMTSATILSIVVAIGAGS